MKPISLTLLKTPNFKKFFSGLLATNFRTSVADLGGEGYYTVFVPSDEAFSKLPLQIQTNLLGNLEALRTLLSYHIVPEKILSEELILKNSIKTLNGNSVLVSNSNGLKLNDSKIIKTDILCSNGVIHEIDTLLIPEPNFLENLPKIILDDE